MNEPTPPSIPTPPPGADGQAPFGWSRFLVWASGAALLAGVLLGGLDAAQVRWFQADRLFTPHLLGQSMAAHTALCLVLALVLATFYRILPRKTRSRLSAACPFLVCLSVIAAVYFVVFVGFYYYVDLVNRPDALVRLRSYPAIAFGVLLLLSSILVGRTVYRLLNGPADVVFVLNFLFGGQGDLTCPDAADTNDSGDINLADAVQLLNFLFSAGQEPAPPLEECGEDPTEDENTECDYAACEG